MEPKQTSWQRTKWLWIILVIIIIIVGSFFVFRFWTKNSESESKTKNSSGQVVLIPPKILDNTFGWLGGGAEDDGKLIVEAGGAWVRPHPGPFVWDMMQSGINAKIDFDFADRIVENYSGNNLGILATIFPFADWDQEQLANAVDCQVADNDEFLKKNDQKGRDMYLPKHRCNPNDWNAYKKWVTTVVERYDGDGINDMPGLKIPIKYWEVMNEPDLAYNNTNQPPSEEKSLNFYKQGPTEYAKLLIETSNTIRQADPQAKVLIAGAAGADSRMLGFYEGVFANKDTFTSFDFGNVHCISNDRTTHDFNVGPYKEMLNKFNLTQTIWVTEAEAMYSGTGDENYESTKTSTTGALDKGAQKIFFTRYNFDDSKDISQKIKTSKYPSTEKYQDLIKVFSN